MGVLALIAKFSGMLTGDTEIDAYAKAEEGTPSAKAAALTRREDFCQIEALHKWLRIRDHPPGGAQSRPSIATGAQAVSLV